MTDNTANITSEDIDLLLNVFDGLVNFSTDIVQIIDRSFRDYYAEGIALFPFKYITKLIGFFLQSVAYYYDDNKTVKKTFELIFCCVNLLLCTAGFILYLIHLGLLSTILNSLDFAITAIYKIVLFGHHVYNFFKLYKKNDTGSIFFKHLYAKYALKNLGLLIRDSLIFTAIILSYWFFPLSIVLAVGFFLSCLYSIYKTGTILQHKLNQSYQTKKLISASQNEIKAKEQLAIETSQSEQEIKNQVNVLFMEIVRTDQEIKKAAKNESSFWFNVLIDYLKKLIESNSSAYAEFSKLQNKFFNTNGCCISPELCKNFNLLVGNEKNKLSDVKEKELKKASKNIIKEGLVPNKYSITEISFFDSSVIKKYKALLLKFAHSTKKYPDRDLYPTSFAL